MPIESGTHINQLNASNPPGTDGLAEADDHLRKIKLALTTDLPNIGGAVTATHTVINAALAADPSGVARTEGVGSIHAFPKAPTGLGTGASGTGHRYLELDGSVWTIADFPDLGAFYGSTFGGNGTTTFGVPDWKTLGKFPRSRTGSLAVGTAQTSAVKKHTHAATSSAVSGNTTNTGLYTPTGGNSPPIATTGVRGDALVGTPGPGQNVNSGAVAQANKTGDDGTLVAVAAPTFTGVATGDPFTHSFNVTPTITVTNTMTPTGDTDETRPEAYAVIYCCKT